MSGEQAQAMHDEDDCFTKYPEKGRLFREAREAAMEKHPANLALQAPHDAMMAKRQRADGSVSGDTTRTALQTGYIPGWPE